MTDFVDVSQDIKLIRYGYLRQFKQFCIGVYDSSDDDKFIVVQDEAWKFISRLMQRVDEFEKNDIFVEFRPENIGDSDYRHLKPRFDRSPYVSGWPPALPSGGPSWSGTIVHYEGEQLKVKFSIYQVRTIHKRTKKGYAKVEKFPCEVQYRYGQKTSQLFCNAKGEIHDPGPKTPAVTVWNITLYRDFQTGNHNRTAYKIGKRLSTSTFYQNGKKERRTGPADIVYSISNNVNGKPKIVNEYYFKEGINITDQVEAAGGIDQIDDFTWEML